MDSFIVIIAIVCIVIYSITLAYLNIFCIVQLRLLYAYRRKPSLPPVQAPATWPKVTIQLPIYNEQYVIERLLDHVAALDYPTEQLDIQVLDDSDDETTSLASAKITQLREGGHNIQLIHRPDRVGYKAGALAYGLDMAKGEYIAIFDADFLPRPDFLKRTVPSFVDPKVGVVQTRWEHINESYSLLTRVQAFQLNAHFTVEQMGRQASDLLLQFNGTAGIWRKTTIRDAGGWQHDTLTEDLDLSYRAQLRGWQIRYLEEVGTPAELPAEMTGLRSQQYRWMKGGAETARKVLPQLWKSALPFHKKIHGSIHLLSSAVFVILLVAAVISYPVMVLLSILEWKLTILSVFFVGLVSLILVYIAGNYPLMPKEMSRFTRICRIVVLFPVFLALSMGLSLHNSIAVLRGFMGQQSPFVRTPKFNLMRRADAFSDKRYYSRRIKGTVWIELLLTLYFFSALIFGLVYGNYAFLFYHAMLCIGFGTICYLSIKHATQG